MTSFVLGAALVCLEIGVVCLVALALETAGRRRGIVRAGIPAWCAAAPLVLLATALFPPVLDTPTIDIPHAMLDRPVLAGGVPLAWSTVLATVWGVGALVRCVSLARGIAGAHRLARTARPCTDARVLAAATWAASAVGLRGRRLRIASHPALVSPAVVGVIGPTILLPVDAAAWDDARLRAAFCHEAAHVRRHDWARMILDSVLGAVCWPAPGLALLGRRLAQSRELAADRAVLDTGTDPAAYATQLLALARRCTESPRLTAIALGPTRSADLAERVHALFAEPVAGRHGASPTVVGATIGLLVLLLALTRPVLCLPTLHL